MGTGNGGTSATGAGGGSAAAGPGLGTGAGASTGSGASSAGAGHGPGPFAGITIQGGEGVTGAAVEAASRNAITVVQPQSYSMTVVSTASSGGGLADFGVFAKEPVYTVYLAMRATPDDPAPSWTLQYALVKPSTDDSDQTAGGLVPPFPSTKVPLNLPAELVRKYRTRQVVVYAIVDTKGKMQGLTVKQTPGDEINKPILDALSKWTFRPAEVNGVPVATKVLIGIPVV